MPVDSLHKQYEEYSDQWQRIRDAIAGSDAVKDGSTAYLPKPGGMPDVEYNAYRQRALFFNATSRVLDGLAGAIFRKDPDIADWPANLEDNLENITLTGVPLDDFAKMIATEVVAEARAGVITDFSSAANQPYLRLYRAEDITNWRVTVSGGVPTLALVVLREISETPKPDDPFETDDVDERLVLGLDEDGFYWQQRWRRLDRPGVKQEFVALGDPDYPQIRGAKLDYIPFQFFAPDNLSASVCKSPLLNLVDLNISHYITSAELEHAAHFTAMPTPWIAGSFMNNVQPERVHIGSGSAWLLEQGANVGMLSTGGDGLAALENRMQHKEQQMAVAGARLLEDQKIAAEAAATVRLRHSGENSVLAGIARTVGRGLSNNLNWYLAWLDRSAKPVNVKLNTDFFDGQMTSDELTAWVSAWQGGAIGNETLYHNLQQGEVLPEGWTLEEFQEDQDSRSEGLAGIGLAGLDEMMQAQSSTMADEADHQ